MRLKAYIWGIRSITLISFLAVGAIVYFVDPTSSGIIGAALFYLAIFFSLAGAFNLFLLGMRRRFIGDELAAENVGISFRQGTLLSILVIGILVLQSYRLLIWWDALLVLGGVFLAEVFFLSRS
ncbi:MAG: hypothetical protein P4L62_00595 [Candidatus Pacebacteria bacterium]|nr:hypothetical protein [Candidatus Paceibacterota bacterium]